MKTALLLCLLPVGLSGFAQDWKKDRPVAGLTGLSVNSGIDVYLTQGTSEKLTLDVRGIEEEEVISEVRNGVLKLYIRHQGGWGGWNWSKNRYVKAYLTFRQLANIQANGGSDVFSQGTLTFNELNLQVNGGADVKLALKADVLNLQTNGGADAEITGSARTLNADGNGGSDLRASKFTAEVVNASSNGGSDVYVYATRELALKASGGADLYYSGPAKIRAKSKSGGADITQRD